jgi:hypothetical protein
VWWLFVLLPITAGGFVREAHRVVVGYVVEDCCFLSLPGECVVLRLLILSTSTAEGFVREARPIVV